MDQTTCTVCFGDLDEAETVTLPGCGHAFHTACILTAAQYDVKCPVCRRVPNGIDERASPQQRAHPLERSVFITLDDLSAVEDIAARRAEWNRYRQRRRRCLNQNPRLLEAFNALHDVRRRIEVQHSTACREYRRECRRVWTANPVIREHVRVAGRLRRRELRLERLLHQELVERIGPEPE